MSLSLTSRGLGHPKPCSLSPPRFPKCGWDCKGNVFTTDSSGSFRPAIRPASQCEDCVGQESLPEGTLSVRRSHRQGQDKPQTRQILSSDPGLILGSEPLDQDPAMHLSFTGPCLCCRQPCGAGLAGRRALSTGLVLCPQL